MKKAKVNLDPQKLLGFRLYPDAKVGDKTGPKIGQTKAHKLGSKIGTKKR